MDSKSIDELIEYFLIEKRNGMDFSEIRKTLESKELEENKIKIIIRSIDNLILKEEKTVSQNKKAKELIYIGLAVTLAGLFVTVGTYTGIINMGNSFLLAYGPVSGGIGILFTGLGKYEKL
ncbi:MAG: hypothetical protein M3Q58_00640 [Bacteroidota bacterium]|nr:hypothetical protein [Bacteroidota bacterium]